MGNNGKAAREKDINVEHENSFKKYKMKAIKQQ